MKNDETPETNLTVEMLRDLFGRTYDAASGLNMDAIEETMALLIELSAKMHMKPRANDPPPEAKYKEGDWVQDMNRPPFVQYVEHVRLSYKAAGDGPFGGPFQYGFICEDGPAYRYENELQPIPPKPETVPPGFRLAGEVLVCDGRAALHGKHYIGVNGAIWCGDQPTSMCYMDGRRWMIEPGPTCCPHCHKEL